MIRKASKIKANCILSFEFDTSQCDIDLLTESDAEELMKLVQAGDELEANDYVSDLMGNNVIYQDYDHLNVWCTPDGGNSFQLKPRNPENIRAVACTFRFDRKSTYIIRRGWDLGWGRVEVEAPFQRRQFKPEWIHAKKPGWMEKAFGGSSLSKVFYKGIELDFDQETKVRSDEVFVMHKGKKFPVLSGT